MILGRLLSFVSPIGFVTRSVQQEDMEALTQRWLVWRFLMTSLCYADFTPHRDAIGSLIYRWLESFGETFQSGWFKQIAWSFRDGLCLLFSLLYIFCPTDLDRPWSSCFTWLVACLSYVECNFKKVMFSFWICILFCLLPRMVIGRLQKIAIHPVVFFIGIALSESK